MSSASIDERPGRPPPIAPAPTAIAAFAGPAPRGPAGTPVTVRSFAEYEREFGGVCPESGLGHAVRDFFAGHGRHAVVLRLAPGSEETGLSALEGFTLLSLPPAPADGDVRDDVWSAAAALCADRRALLLVDPPAAAIAATVRAWTGGIAADRADAAVYFPRLRGGLVPSGAIAATIARTDAERGVWRTPAGTGATVLGTSGPAVELDDAELERLRPVNGLRTLPGGATVVWGARTLHDGEWKYVNVRRLALFLEHSIGQGLRWAMFEPNGEPLWARVRDAVDAFLHDLFRQGAFAGSAPRDAYLVRCGRDTMTEDDIRNGRFIVEVGFAPLKPAEFVILRIGLRAGC